MYVRRDTGGGRSEMNTLYGTTSVVQTSKKSKGKD